MGLKFIYSMGKRYKSNMFQFPLIFTKSSRSLYLEIDKTSTVFRILNNACALIQHSYPDVDRPSSFCMVINPQYKQDYFDGLWVDVTNIQIYGHDVVIEVEYHLNRTMTILLCSFLDRMVDDLEYEFCKHMICQVVAEIEQSVELCQQIEAEPDRLSVETSRTASEVNECVDNLIDLTDKFADNLIDLTDESVDDLTDELNQMTIKVKIIKAPRRFTITFDS
jgi:hypothetical protein